MMDPDKFDSFYTDRYSSVCVTAQNGLAAKSLHQSLELGHSKKHYSKVLEVGGNKGEHIPHVKHSFDRYVLTDLRKIDESELKALFFGSPVEFKIADCQDLPFESDSFDRVIATCLFHHLPDPEAAFSELRRVAKLSRGGVIDILIPTDPGMMYRIARQLTSLRKARSLGLYEEIQLTHAREHRNHCGALLKLLDHVFAEDSVSIRNYPFMIKSWNLNLFSAIRIQAKSEKD